MTPATQTLLSKADVEQADGNLTAAASTLERALRIENHPLLWNRLAGVRLQQQQYSLAADLAEKSNALAANDNSLRRNNWELIARARQAAGDSAAAQDAVQRANALR
jgi:tetratricopeptide (TPR) repeat protein